MQKRNAPSGRGGGSTLKFKSPKPERTAGRFAFLLAACLLLPPVGVAYAWHTRMHSVTQRLFLTLAGVFSLTLILTFALAKPGQVDEILPAPVVPLPINYVEPTAAPAPGGQSDGGPGDGAQALPQETPAPDETGAPAEGDPAPEATPEATPEPIIVYAVSDNASLYHAADTCEGQVNARSLTLDEALQAGLTPCDKCNPPAP